MEADPAEILSESQELTSGASAAESELEAEPVAASSDSSTMTWYKPKYHNRPCSPSAFEPGHGNDDDRNYNDRGTQLFCKWKGYKYVTSWEGGHDDTQHGTQKFHANHPGDAPKVHCQQCKR